MERLHDPREHSSRIQTTTKSKMSDLFSFVLSCVLLACLLVSGHSSPIGDESSFNGQYEKEENTATSERNGLASNKVNRFSGDGTRTLPGVETIAPTTRPEMEETKKEDGRREVNIEDDSDSESESEYEDGDENVEEKSALKIVDNRKRREEESDEDTATQTESEFIDHVLDYNLERKKREEDGERKRRQSGETVPYVIPNRSRRDDHSDTQKCTGRNDGQEMEAEEEQKQEQEVEGEDEEKMEDADEKLTMES